MSVFVDAFAHDRFELCVFVLVSHGHVVPSESMDACAPLSEVKIDGQVTNILCLPAGLPTGLSTTSKPQIIVSEGFENRNRPNSNKIFRWEYSDGWSTVQEIAKFVTEDTTRIIYLAMAPNGDRMATNFKLNDEDCLAIWDLHQNQSERQKNKNKKNNTLSMCGIVR